MPEYNNERAKANQQATQFKAELQASAQTGSSQKSSVSLEVKLSVAVKANRKKPRYTRYNFGFADYFWISLMWFGISYLWGGINGVILPNLNSRFVNENYKGTTLGVITMVGMLIAIVVQPAAGALSDISHHRWGRRRPFILAGGVMAIVGVVFMTTMVIFFGNWWMLLLCYVILQFADNIAQGAYQGFIPDIVPESKRGRASGAMGVAQTFGNVGGLAVATALIDVGHTELALLLIVLVFSLMLVLTLVTVKEEPLPPVRHKINRFKVVVGTIQEISHHHDFKLFIISRLFVLTAMATITVFALYYLQDVFGQREGMLTGSYSTLAAFVVLASIVSVLPAVWLSERIGRKRMVIIACLIGAGGMVMLATASSLTQVIIYGAIIGVALGSFNSIDWALATDLIPREAAGRFMGVSNLAGAGSQALAALCGGALRDSFNAIGVTFFGVHNLGYSAIFIMSTFFFLVGAFFVQKIKDPKENKGLRAKD